MRTFVGAGQPYIEDQLLHVIAIDPTLAEPWRRPRWDAIKQAGSKVPNVLSCIPHQQRVGEITITVSDKLSARDHQAALDGVVAALESIGLHSGEADIKGLRI